MTSYIYTIHANEKLKRSEIRKLKINRKTIENVVEKPNTINKSDEPVIIAIDSLTRTLSLCVVYRKVEEKIRIITFYPAEKGRYERKIL
jgi:hypothetical protein